jgi:hypothetical protein
MTLSGWERVSRADPVYKACLIVSTAGGAIAGGATGTILGPAGTLGGYAGGAAWGFAAGFLLCPYLAPAIKRKLEMGDVFGEADLRNAAEAMGRYAGVTQANEALRLLAVVRRARLSPRSPVCGSPRLVARHLLAT